MHCSCDFCDLHFFGVDEQYTHMNRNHYTCHVCQRAGVLHLYFKDGQEMEVGVCTRTWGLCVLGA